jgi:hypothetical protein
MASSRRYGFQTIAQTRRHICDRRHSHPAGCRDRLVVGHSKLPRHTIPVHLLTLRDAASLFQGLPFGFSNPIATAYSCTSGQSEKCSLLQMLESRCSTSVTAKRSSLAASACEYPRTSKRKTWRS